jgi:PAS domain S-box-containing protein
VDDDNLSRHAFRHLFQKAGFEVREAENGDEALRLVQEEPDLVVLDVNLPDINGFEVCRRIKAHPATAGIPVLHLSAVYVRTEDKTHGLEGGSDAYLTKPVEPEEVIATARALLRIRRAEEEARTAARHWQTTFDAIPDPVWLVDRTGRVERCNRAMAELFGRPGSEVIGCPYRELAEQAFGPRAQPLLANGDQPGRREVSELELAGRWFRLAVSPVLDDRGVETGTVLLLADISERKRAERDRDRLLAERTRLVEHLRLLLESTGEGIYGMGPEGRCTFVNRAAAEMFGATAEELVGGDLHALTHHSRSDGTPYPPEHCPMLAAAREGRSCRVEDEVFWRRDGASFPVEYAASPIRQGDVVRGAVITFSDRTQRNRLEEQLRQAQKMEAVGRLAGGIAHDFNNLLTAITGTASLLLATCPADDPNVELLRTIDKAAWRAADLTRQLLGFSRQSTLWLRPTDLRGVVEEVVNILRRTIDPRIAVEVMTAADLWVIQADPSHLSQVLMNLCLNACDAMHDGGRLFLLAENCVLEEGDAGRHVEARPGPFVHLQVADTGHGIPPDVMPRIFDPFFTTKEPGKGTGLGLAMVYGIVKQHKGWVECTSEVGKGARFDVYLPRAPMARPIPAFTGAGSAPGGGSETVLLVDDDAMIRHIGTTVLKRYGYRVMTAEDGLEAVQVYREHVGQINLVVLDLTMPHLSGTETLGRLREINPRVGVLLASGYYAGAPPEPTDKDVLGFLQKPYRGEDLANSVRTALDRVRKERRAAEPRK